MIFRTGCLLLLVLLFLASPSPAADCLECHEKLSPGQVQHYRASAHAGKVDCSGCHGEDHEGMISGLVKVTAETCGGCHPKQLAEHRHSKHGEGLHNGWGCTRNQPERDQQGCRFCHAEGSTTPVSKVQCARFLTQTAEIQQVGCNRCHQVEDSCAACHSNHQTSLELVRTPAVCSKCHMGPDHPQWEMWQTSQHGQLYTAGGASAGPSCLECHMAGGSHDVSFGITVSPGGKVLAEPLQSERRQQMQQLCQQCHAASFVAAELERDDAVRQQSLQLVAEAREIIADLADRGLLQPMPAERPPHPLRQDQLVLDGQMLYENLSHIERLFFKMMKYDFAKTWKGAFHQNPDYAHWYGNAELKLDLSDIKAEALRLKQERGGVAQPADDPVEEQLMLLKRRFDRGALTADEYAKEKSRLLGQ